MKIVAEYLDKAIAFEQMAAREKDAKLQADLEGQAMAYRKLATERAKKLKAVKPSPIAVAVVHQDQMSEFGPKQTS